MRSGWKKRGHLFALIVLVMLAMTGCGDPYLSTMQPKGESAEISLGFMKLSLYVMLFVMGVAYLLFAIAVIRFRRRKGDDSIPEQWEGNTKLEIIWTVIPIIILALLAIPTIQQTFALAQDDNPSEDMLKVKVTAHQYWWEFEYPDHGIITAQDLYIPTGQQVYVELTSKDVLHSFWVPALAGKLDTNPGEINRMRFDAIEPGVYDGKCAELCGPSHALMDFKVIALEPDDFNAWLEKMKNPAPAPTSDVAKRGEEVFQQSCLACHGTDSKTKSIGPNLTNFGERAELAGVHELNKENLIEWIKNPSNLKPGVTKMPGFEDKISEEDISALAEYLLQLKQE